MTKIEEFLTKFDDQHLANLQCAAEDGRLVFMDACNCLLYHLNGTYSETKWDPEIGPLARAAESEFLRLGGSPESWPVLSLTRMSDPQRRERILPMIHAEWARRAKEVVPAQTTENVHEISEMETFTQVSLSVR